MSGTEAVANGRPTERAELSFDGQTVVGQDFSGLTLDQFYASNSRFENCRFDRMRVKMFTIGGRMMLSTFVGCSFDRARLEMHPGGAARFEGCTFRDATVTHWNTDRCDLVDSVFSGTIRKSIFYGRVTERRRQSYASAGISLPDVNDVRGNDFSNARLVDVWFRGGVDLRLQELPTGPDYFYFENSADTLRRAYPLVQSWTSELRKRGLAAIENLTYEAELGQEQMLLIKADWRPEELWNGLCAALQGRPWPDKDQ